MTNPIAIHYRPDGFQAESGRILGRQSAGAGFLNAYLQGTDGEVICYAESSRHFEQFCRLVSRLWPQAQTEWVRSHELAKLSAVGCLYEPDPEIAQLARRRSLLGETSYSICGVTHTLCSLAVYEQLLAILTGPLQEWDALVCTSNAGHTAVTCILEAWQEHYSQSTGAKAALRLQLPVIPLGVDCDRFEPTPARQAGGAELRHELGIAPDTVVFLYFGRLSYHAKANPLPMYRALELAVRSTGKKVELLHFGWFPNDTIRRHFEDAARIFCPSVRCSFLDGKDERLAAVVWHAADVFTCLADNIQETFGLAPIEAMAAGLPCVVSDWDGYRDTVRDGIDGFRVRTSMSSAGGEELFGRYAAGADNYDHYIGNVSQCVAVSIEDCAKAYALLINDRNLRKTTSTAAQRHARSVFDWPVVMQAYRELWQDLTARRAFASALENRRIVDGASPFKVFASYASSQLDEHTMLEVSNDMGSADLGALASNPLMNFAMSYMCSEAECEQIIHTLSTRASTLAELLSSFPADRHNTLQRTLCWLLKAGIFETS